MLSRLCGIHVLQAGRLECEGWDHRRHSDVGRWSLCGLGLGKLQVDGQCMILPGLARHVGQLQLRALLQSWPVCCPVPSSVQLSCVLPAHLRCQTRLPCHW